MVHEAHAAWDRLWADLGQSHFHPTGTLVVARDEDGWARASAMSRGHGAAARDLAPDELAARLPFLRFEGACFALFTPTGVLFAERILEVAPLAHAARRAPAPRSGRNRRRHRAPGGAHRRRPHRCGRCAGGRGGPWTPRLLPALRGRVTPSRQVALHPSRRTSWRPGGRRPPFSTSSRRRAAASPVPPVDGTRLKVGDHVFTLRGSRMERASRGRPHADDDGGAQPAGRLRALPSGCGQDLLLQRREDERFIVEPVGRALVLAGFSGHGFKFGAVIGEAVAAALAGEPLASDPGPGRRAEAGACLVRRRVV